MSINQEMLKELLDYNLETGQMIWINPSNYHRHLKGKIAGVFTKNNSGKMYCKIQIDGRKYNRSRLAWMWMTGSWPQDMIDHIDGNSMNDAWCNLREADCFTNSWNHQKRKKKSPLPMGVRQSQSGKYVARISCNKKHITIGTFESPEIAHQAYCEARREYFGKFA